jgi:hypothetical protein
MIGYQQLVKIIMAAQEVHPLPEEINLATRLTTEQELAG